MKSSIFRPIQLVLLGAIALVLIALFVTSWLTWREQARLSSAHAVLSDTLAFHDQHGLVEETIVAVAGGGTAQQRAELLQELDELADLCSSDDHQTRALLSRLRSHVQSDMYPPDQYRNLAIALLHDIAMSEAHHEARLISRLHAESGTQLRYELAAPIALALLLLIAIPIVRRRFMKPLEDFGRQMSGLAEGNFTPTATGEVSEHTLPLHRNFIKLAARLQELEREQRERAESLEEEVRRATETLLEQQQSLARAERLAVAGELAASVAHEIRNPLAGIQMSLVNLRSDHSGDDVEERIDLIVAEVERLARLVGEIVDAARHEPEASSRFEIAPLVDELLALTRYQMPPGIQIESRVEQELMVRTQKERLRQALLNLVLNASKAIGPESGSIEIEIAREGDGVRIVVSDDGPGFPPEVLDAGVRPFYSTRSRGAGLGLAMVRRFIREAEGSLVLENGTGDGDRPGARVKLLLPSTVEHG